MTFVRFAGIDPPTAIDEDEARWLHAQLLRRSQSRHAQPSDAQIQAALKIQRGWEQGGVVELAEDETRSVVAILDEGASPSHIASERLRWVQQHMRRSLGEDVH